MKVEKVLMQRCDAKCELCSADSELSVFEVPPESTPTVENCIMICSICANQINNTTSMDSNHWRCLNDSMWSQTPAVQVMAWRLLKKLSHEAWAQDLFEMLYFDDELLQWAESGIDTEVDTDSEPTLDSNGAKLESGDTVTLIKDLEVKGANFTAKRGTAVRNISLTSNPEHIEGRVNGVRIVLLTKFLKKMN